MKENVEHVIATKLPIFRPIFGFLMFLIILYYIWHIMLYAENIQSPRETLFFINGKIFGLKVTILGITASIIIIPLLRLISRSIYFIIRSDKFSLWSDGISLYHNNKKLCNLENLIKCKYNFSLKFYNYESYIMIFHSLGYEYKIHHYFNEQPKDICSKILKLVAEAKNNLP